MAHTPIDGSYPGSPRSRIQASGTVDSTTARARLNHRRLPSMTALSADATT